MLTVKNRYSFTTYVSKSKFIGLLYPVFSVEEAKDVLNKIRSQYGDASHICYAYIIDDANMGFSDDNEPNGSAGKPMLDLLAKNNLSFILGIVIRYFGGTKLGRANLLRTYVNTLNTVVKEATFINVSKGYLVRITFSYDEISYYNDILLNSSVINKSFDKMVSYLVRVDMDTFNRLNNGTIEVVDECYVEISAK